MSKRQKYDFLKHTFPFPNDIFLLGLSPGALAVYTYLLCCENRKTHQCWPSYRAIGKAVNMSNNTVSKYICELADKGLISAEYTYVVTRDGKKRNGNLLYTILPIQDAIDRAIRQKLDKLERQTAQLKQGSTQHSSCFAL